MSDFFTSLVERSVGTAPVIRPRLISLFEPIRGEVSVIGNELANASQEAPFHLETERDSERPRPQKGERQVAHSLPEEDEQRLATIANTSRASSKLRPPVREVQESPQVVVESTAQREVAKSAMQPRIPRETAERAVSASTLREQEPALAGPPKLVPQIATPSRREVKFEDERGLMIPPKATPEMRLSDLALSARQDRRQQEKRSLLSEASQPIEPTVQVTIGRIEVRARKESSPSQRAGAKSPVMSLDEYLRGRGRQVSQ